MCIRTVEGDPGTLRTVQGTAGNERTIDGETSFIRNISGIGGGTSLLGTKPTYTEISATGSSTYITPAGCVYIDVYLIGGAGGASSGSTGTNRRNGGSGGAGGIAFGYFAAGTYAYDIKAGGAGGSGGNGTASSGSSTFGNLSVTGGGGGLRAAATSTTYAPASSGVATNSVLPFGVFTAQAPGNIGTNGGANTFKGWAGVGEVRNASENGNVGFTGGGGSGGCETGGVGGAGGDGYLLIIEYY